MYKLLIVDDEKAILEGMKSTLDWKRLSIGRIETAQNYLQAMDIALEMRPEIALFDVCIGEHKGYEIMQKLNELGLKTKYVMFSGYDTFEYARQAMLCGARGYLLKPVDRTELEKMMVKVTTEDLGGRLSLMEETEAQLDAVLAMPYHQFSKLTNKILLIVQEEYGSNLNLKVIADKFQMNSTYLGQIFLKDARMKFSDYLMRFRLNKAREMIETTNGKIAVIARKTGFTNTNYFYAQFHELFSLSPSDLRGKSEGGVGNE